MKKLFLVALLAAGFTAVQAQKPFNHSDEPVLVYSLPATELVFDLEIEKVTEKPGVFYQYSQRYLATTGVVTEESLSYQLKSVRMTTRPVVDKALRFSVSPDLVPGLVLTSEGLLAGVNVPSPRKVIKERHIEHRMDTPLARPEGMIALNQEYMMAGSTAKMAEGAAYQIYALRESRLNLLSGEMENLPADGESLKLMLQGLDRQERELTELFAGQVRKETFRHRITLIPDSSQHEALLFRLSAKRGIVASDDLGGEPYYIAIDHETIPQQAPVVVKAKGSKKSKTPPPVVALYTVLPVNATIEVSDGVNTLLREQTSISHFGVLLPHDASLFKSKTIQMEVDPATGRMVRIQQ